MNNAGVIIVWSLKTFVSEIAFRFLLRNPDIGKNNEYIIFSLTRHFLCMLKTYRMTC